MIWMKNILIFLCLVFPASSFALDLTGTIKEMDGEFQKVQTKLDNKLERQRREAERAAEYRRNHPTVTDDNTVSSSVKSSTNKSSSKNNSASLSCGQIGCRGVKRIDNNGSIAGNPSYAIRCVSGDGIVIKKGNRWADSGGFTYSNKYNGMSVQRFANEMCNK